MKITIETDQPAIPTSIPEQTVVRSTTEASSQLQSLGQNEALDAGASNVNDFRLEPRAPAVTLAPSSLNGDEQGLSAGAAKH